MKTDTLATQLSALIDRHAAPVSSGRSETHANLETIAKRIGAPDTAHVEALIHAGVIKSNGPLRRGEVGGITRFSSDSLNDAKRAIVESIAEAVVENWPDDADPQAITLAVGHALDAYKKSLADGTAAKGFAALPSRAIAFARGEENERPGLLRRAAGVAAVGGAAYAGASYLRGRRAGVVGILPALKTGHKANVATVRKVGARVGSLLRPRAFSAELTPARARNLLLRLGRELRRNGNA